MLMLFGFLLQMLFQFAYARSTLGVHSSA